MGLLEDKLPSASNQDDLLDESQVKVSKNERSQIEQSGSDGQYDDSSDLQAFMTIYGDEEESC